MSFSATVKSQLCRVECESKCCMVAELAGVFGTAGALGKDGGVRVYTENAAFARRIFRFIRDVFSAYPEIAIRKSSRFKKHINYTIAVTPQSRQREITEELGIKTASGADSDTAALTYGDRTMEMLSNPC